MFSFYLVLRSRTSFHFKASSHLSVLTLLNLMRMERTNCEFLYTYFLYLLSILTIRKHVCVSLDSKIILFLLNRIVPFQFGIISQNSQQSFGKEVDSSQVIYAPTVYQSVECISSGNNVMSYNKEPNTTQCGVQHEGMKYSGIENKTYDKHSTDQFNNRNTFVLPFPKFPFPKINPTIEMDGPRTGFLDATNIKSTFFHNTPFITSCTPGNQNPFIDCGNKSVADASFGQVFLTAWDTIPVDSGYQDVQSLCINAAEPDCHNVKPSLQIIPSIEMDCSYHRV